MYKGMNQRFKEHTMMSGLIVLLVVAVLVVPSFAQTASPPRPASAPTPAPAPVSVPAPLPADMMANHLKQEIHKALAARQQEYEALKTPEQIKAYQERRRTAMIDALGGFPDKTPLNAKVTGRVQCDGYRIEKVLFESRPGLIVSALLYLPDGTGPFAASIVPCGHSENGKAYESYQQASILLAKNGIAALCYDPPGQGERSQIVAQNGLKPLGPTVQHTLIGTGSILLGRNVAADIIWDGIRAIDYLQSRSDIDGSHIVCTGNSGGGTQTSYLMAIEPRITCAVPCCYLTSWARLTETIGPQDAEQNLYGQIAFGLDHADYAILMAPRPLLFGVATQDFFDIAGSWDSFRQAKRIYTRLGVPERVDIVEVDLPHNYARELRMPMVRWMRGWLFNKFEPVVENPTPVKFDAELNCTPKGQVMSLEGAKSLFDFNSETETKLAAGRRELWQKTPRQQILEKVRQLVVVRPLNDLPQPSIKKLARQERDGYTLTNIELWLEPDLALAGLLFEPAKATGDACLYLNGNGKETDAAPGGPIEALVRQGRVVLAVDLPGIRQTEGGGSDQVFGPNFKDYFMAYLLGRSYLGMRVEDALICQRFLAEYGTTGGTKRQVHSVGIGEAGPAALHAAALQPELFASLRLERSLRSWAEVVRTPISNNQLTNAVHGALKVYDLPDLAATLPAPKLQIVDPLDPAGKPAK